LGLEFFTLHVLKSELDGNINKVSIFKLHRKNYLSTLFLN